MNATLDFVIRMLKPAAHAVSGLRIDITEREVMEDLQYGRDTDERQLPPVAPLAAELAD